MSVHVVGVSAYGTSQNRVMKATNEFNAGCIRREMRKDLSYTSVKIITNDKDPILQASLKAQQAHDDLCENQSNTMYK